ncbi:hypothetical protein MH117_04060 [Paenibacillus sp. ACRRX]|uniref:hypothetical protein n=1 Tax=Paenibacillus sp. ACRRX TaxID=2918206 RepID=UPI001EF61EB7|nr:hypothetical protein [Paenibacillus sp. ACRRX]MCG7406581.1 hypothetical protein [Paenibacillus sp. ACRRX]
MKRKNKKIIVLGLATFILITGTSVYASGAISSLFPTVSSEHQDKAKIVEERLTHSWNKGREIIQKSEQVKVSNRTDVNADQDLTNWTFVNSHNLKEDILSSFSKEEQSSFLEAFYSEERSKNLEIGDKMSALLISPDKSQILVYWEKANGSYVVIQLKTKITSSHTWYVDGVSILPAK